MLGFWKLLKRHQFSQQGVARLIFSNFMAFNIIIFLFFCLLLELNFSRVDILQSFVQLKICFFRFDLRFWFFLPFLVKWLIKVFLLPVFLNILPVQLDPIVQNYRVDEISLILAFVQNNFFLFIFVHLWLHNFKRGAMVIWW